MPRAMVAVLIATSGCAGLYGELAVTSTPSTKLTPNSGGAGVDAGGGTTVGFNVGVDFGNTRKRFAIGGGVSTTSFDAGESKASIGTWRYDHALIQLAERASLRLGVGSEVGNATGSSGGMSTDGLGLGVFGGVGATYYPTWRTPVHVLVGPHWLTREAGGEQSLSGVGITARIAIGITAKDPRPDITFVVPLEKNRDITEWISAGGSAIGCTTEDRGRNDYMASLTLRCDGKRIEYFQIAEGMLITCKRQASRSRCEQLNQRIVEAASAKLDGDPPSAPSAPAAPAAPAPIAPAPTPAPAEPAPAVPTPADAPAAPSDAGTGQ